MPTLDKIFWIDLEMTGLDVESEVIIEVGAIITDINFKEVDRYHAVINQPPHFIEHMDDWNTQHHTESGLIDLIPSGKSPKEVEDDLCSLTDQHFSKESPAVIAGNSIHQDRAFIQFHFKKLFAKLHYRMLDVSSWKLLLKEKYDFEYKKQNRHRAVDDIEESIAELKAYLEFFEDKKKPSE